MVESDLALARALTRRRPGREVGRLGTPTSREYPSRRLTVVCRPAALALRLAGRRALSGGFGDGGGGGLGNQLGELGVLLACTRGCMQ